MLHLVHHPAPNTPVELRGEGPKDVVMCAFGCTLVEMIALLPEIRVNRAGFGLTTGDLYITERGRTVLHISKGD